MENDDLILKNIIQVIDNQYFGCVSYYNSLFWYSNTKIERCDNFQKMSFRNRCTIAGSNGLVNLTIPVVGGRNKKQLMQDVKIDQTQAWQLQHFKTILSCYGKSPFFEFYRDDVEKLLKCQDIFLFDFNFKILIWLKKILQLPGEIEVTNNFIVSYDSSDIIDNRNKWLPKNFQQADSHSIIYQQVFEGRIGFQKNLSILDLLFCEGPNAKNLLKSNRNLF
ncbi:MAG: WbqC family protein [Pedobacter sp.]|nr:WbqC family protein [Chitinophagaceae bacterium]